MSKFDFHLNNCTLEEAIKSFYDDNPFTKELGIIINKIDKGSVSISLNIKHCHTNVYNITHGGVLMSLSDAAIGAACLSLNKRVVTLDFNINLLRSVPEGNIITATTQIIHDGRQTVVGECSVFDSEGHLCCKSRATMFVLGQLQK
ncbi:PaaI family thioesterase [Pectinatus cerevisiiphilus]|uniref:Acyl-CoA thioesterase n=1 Tax=Pectinatus cerevisiiphilus TaxID=86956 RepID=A0A4R3KFL1_9FIRM|nr:PaaI family thioesterase [Pectinatus cerevisiiphilus]TCS81925.1 acyl-CoA thioesterase [Pectinatus cerevisiiphilus]